MPEKDFYLLIILSVITGFLLIQIVKGRIGRRRQSRRLEREIAEYLRKRAAGQHNWERVEGMKKKILIVEDNKDSLEILGLRVTAIGYQVIKAKNSKEAIAYAEAEGPDLIFMDLDLPDADGVKTTATLKQNPKTSRIPVVALTAWMSELWREKASKVGIVSYLLKPISPQMLKQTIEKFTNGSISPADSRPIEFSSAYRIGN
jgi:two-component system cell cycle response regulator DivK